MSEPHVKNRVNVAGWILLSIIGGICLGIIAALIVVALNLAYDEFPNGPPSWTMIQTAFALDAIYFGLLGAVIGGIIGSCIGVVKWSEEREKTLDTSS